MSKLKDLYKNFAWELVRTNSGSQAYLNATNKTAVTASDRIKASAQAHRLSLRPEVRKYLQQIRDEQRIGVTEVVSEIANIIRFDPIDMLNEDGTVKALKDMPETARKMIAGFEVSEIWMGRGKDREQYGVVKKMKLINKMDAIEKAMKHLGGYKEDNDQKKSTTQIAIFQLPDNGRTIESVNVGELLEVDVVEKIEETDWQPRGTPLGGNTGPAGELSGDIQTEYDDDDL